MKTQMLMAACVMALAVPSMAAAQAGAGSGAGSGSASSGSNASSNQTTSTSKDGKTTTTTTVKTDENQSRYPWVRTLTNVQVDFTLTDQQGMAAPEKKTVSMLVSSGNWGKIRSAASVMSPGEAPYVVELNVDARPFVSLEGQIQL